MEDNENEAPTVANLIIIRRSGKDSKHPRELSVEDEEMVIGRTDDCDLCIKLPVVSRKQATFRLVKFSPEDDPSAAAGADNPLGVFVVANYGTINPTMLNDRAVGPEGREYVIPHKAIIQVADRQFRMEYPCGCTPAGSNSVQQRLDREWLQNTKLKQSQAVKQGKGGNGGNDNRNAENSHPNNSGDATQDLSKFVRSASSSRGGLKPKAFAQRLETVAENKAAHHPKPQTTQGELVGVSVPATENAMESSEKKVPALAETSPAKSIDSFVNHVESPGKGNGLPSAVPSISSQPILTFTPDEPLTPETSFCSFPHRGNSVTSASAMDVAINHTAAANPDADTQDTTPGATMEPSSDFKGEGNEDGEGAPTPIDIKLPAKTLDTPMKSGIAQSATTMAENRSTMPSASLPTPMRTSITEAAGKRNEKQAATKIPAK
eukprot:CAMPEP_0178560770 /NCGR_PEP_ID=MMETSP0697-20121206/11664_1 /TAXON_ID=265572 /ORGANISM="Extubocellulus spinifer, Strain CCMP396" /LENGTH=434 /DNA_ID=CAMNT_0020194049 /DNA_START=30 /DNA_END=1331 /DNA_ORIENTATION=-